MEVGPRDYLNELLRLCSTMLGGSSRYASLLAAKATECMQVTPRGAMESGDMRIVDVDEELGRQEEDILVTRPMIFENDLLVGDPRLFNLGALSDVSMAWLGSMSEETFVDLELLSEDVFLNQVS